MEVQRDEMHGKVSAEAQWCVLTDGAEVFSARRLTETQRATANQIAEAAGVKTVSWQVGGAAR